MLLHALDQGVLQRVERDGHIGDLAQRDDRVLVVVAIDRERRTRRDVRARCAASSTSSNRLGTLSDAIFDGNASHLTQISRKNISIY